MAVNMLFIARDEADRLEKTLRRQIADQSKPKAVLFYDSGNRDYAPAAQAITASVGTFTNATLLFLFSVSGDGWSEGNAANELWVRYRQWRSAMGESRRLYDAPGHLFEAREAGHLSKAIEFALWLGWDALITAKPGRQLVLLSHDDRMEIYRGSEARILSKKLLALGYWHPGRQIPISHPRAKG